MNNSSRGIVSRLLRQRAQSLASRPVRDVAGALGKLSSRWLRRRDPYRKAAVRRLCERSRFSERVSEALLDALFTELSERRLLGLLRAEIRVPEALDRFAADETAGCRVRATGPSLVTHFCSGNIPNPAVTSLALGFLVKAANVVKPSRRDEGIADLYLESLRDLDRPLASCALILAAPDRSAALECAAASDLVVAYGEDRSLLEISRALPRSVRFIGYGSRASYAVLAREALASEAAARSLCGRLAEDIRIGDQRGCLSPLAVFVERGARVRPERFGEILAETLFDLARRERDPKPGLERAMIHESFRHRMQLLNVRGTPTRVWSSRIAGNATVAWLPRPAAVSDLLAGRGIVVVTEYRAPRDLERALAPVAGKLQAAALEAPPAKAAAIAELLARLGASRICGAGRMQRPPLQWHHDGMPNLEGWIRWTDWERSS